MEAAGGLQRQKSGTAMGRLHFDVDDNENEDDMPVDVEQLVAVVVRWQDGLLQVAGEPKEPCLLLILLLSRRTILVMCPYIVRRFMPSRSLPSFKAAGMAMKGASHWP